MPTFIVRGSWTDQGIRGLKDVPKRIQAARDLAKKLGIDFKQIYLTSGDTDLLVILETTSPDNIPKFNLAIGAMGNIRTSTVRAWTEAETIKLISELP